MKKIVSYYFLTSIALTVFFVYMLATNSVAQIMNFSGYVYYVFAALMHSSIILLIPMLVATIVYKSTRKEKIVSIIDIVLSTLIAILVYVDMQVYSMYRFHINGFVINMITGPNAAQIFTFDIKLILKVALIFAFIIIVYIALWKAAVKLSNYLNIKKNVIIFSSLLLIAIVVNITHAFAHYRMNVTIEKSAKLLPYYFPLTANTLFQNLGFSVPDHIEFSDGERSDVNYPLHEIVANKPDSLPNIVFLFIDAWSRRALTEDCMPNVYKFAEQNLWFKNHFSCSNGIRSSIFTTFFSISDKYWNDFEVERKSPIFIEQMLKNNYNIRIYPSASLQNPPFNRVIFHRVDSLRVETNGKTVYDRDSTIAADFVNDIETLEKSDNPFFAFVFFDLAHSYEMPADKLEKYQPSWKFADYSALNKDMDPTPFFNLYKNCCHQIDKMLAKIFETINLENTIVIVSGDHGQEFNENNRNFWGHNGNFSKYQIGVPFIFHYPNCKAATITYRTTHYDIVPTLLKNYFGVENPIEDFSLGYLLTDSVSRYWQIVGSELNYAFITEGDTIIEKFPDGSIEITDPQLNYISDYKINSVKLQETINKMNAFYK